MRAADIAAKLSAEAEAIAQYLLPNGKRDGREWVCGSVDGESGKSLKVCITGSKAGVWADFAGDAKGDLLDLWMQVRRITLTQACDEAKRWLGVVEAKVEHPRRVFSRPSKE